MACAALYSGVVAARIEGLPGICAYIRVEPWGWVVGTGALQGRNEKLQWDLPPTTVNPNVETCLPTLFGIWCQLLCWARLSLVWVLGSWVPCRWGSLWGSMHLSPPALPDPGFRDHPLHPCCQTAPLSVGPGAIGALWIKAFAS